MCFANASVLRNFGIPPHCVLSSRSLVSDFTSLQRLPVAHRAMHAVACVLPARRAGGSGLTLQRAEIEIVSVIN